MIFSEELLRSLRKEFPCFRNLFLIKDPTDAYEIERIVGKSKSLGSKILEKTPNITNDQTALAVLRLSKTAKRRIDLHEKIVIEIVNYEEKINSLTEGEYYSIDPPHIINKKEIPIIKCLAKFEPYLYFVKANFEGHTIRFNLNLSGIKTHQIKMVKSKGMLIKISA